MRFKRPISAATLLTLSAAGFAHGAGYPIPVRSEPVVGTFLPTGDPAWIDVVQGRDSTTLETRSASGYNGVRTQKIAGHFGLAQVGSNQDSILEGYSRDGRVVVLPQISAGGSSSESTFAVLDSTGVHAPWQVRLHGWFDYDAISPDGRTLFLVEHADDSGFKYHVRAYDLSAKRLLPEAITDPRDPGETMQGMPQQRVTSRDGRWVYTLYWPVRSGQHSFVHALDTLGRSATCTDLPGKLGADLRISLTGRGKLRLTSRSDKNVGTVDTLNRTVATRASTARR